LSCNKDCNTRASTSLNNSSSSCCAYRIGMRLLRGFEIYDDGVVVVMVRVVVNADTTTVA
jgi:hypothetical protein